MKTRRILLLALVLSLLAAPSFAWKFASMADSRGSDGGVNTGILNKIIEKINAENVDLVLFQGDAVNGDKNDAVLKTQMEKWLSCMAKLKAKWYYTPGNHEVKTATSQGILRDMMEMPTNGPADDKELTYSFDHKDAHFVVLNSDRFGKYHKVDTDWMAADLAKNKKPHVFVMAHDPAFPAGPHKGGSLDAYPDLRDDFWKKMTAGRVEMFFCGHEHLYQRTKHGSIIQVINGSCGAPLYKADGAIIKYHYVVVDVLGDKVFCKAKDENGVVIDSWSYGGATAATPACGLCE